MDSGGSTDFQQANEQVLHIEIFPALVIVDDLYFVLYVEGYEVLYVLVLKESDDECLLIGVAEVVPDSEVDFVENLLPQRQ